MRYEDMEFENLRNVYQCIADLPGGLSRAGVAKNLSLSRTAVSLIVSSLISARLVSEGTNPIDTGRGRPGLPLLIDDSYWRVVGAALDVGKWQFVICDLSGNIVRSFEHLADVSSPSLMEDALIDGIKRIQAEYGDVLIPGIGIGVPGIVDTTKGDLLFAFDQSWLDSFNISERVRKETGMKAYVMNRHTLEGVSEFRYANPEKIRDMIYIGVGSGIRSAIFSDGKLMQGAHFSAGRISHLQVNPNGRQCSCGRYGCLITEANSFALHDYVIELLSAGDEASVLRGHEGELTTSMIIQAADSGDAVAAAAVRRVATALAKVICMVADVVDPRKVVIGGPVGTSDSLVGFVNASLDDYYSKSVLPFGRFRASKASIASFSAAHGGAFLVLQDVIPLMLSLIRSSRNRIDL